MEDNTYTEVYNRVPNDVRSLILSWCDPLTASKLCRASKQWYESSKINHVWKQIYFNNFGDFNPKPDANATDWIEEIKKKNLIQIYGFDFDKYKHLLGNVKISFKIDPPLEDLSEGSHIHRRLELVINNKLLPSMGYFGPNDVCYGDWINEVFQPLFKNFDSGTDDLLWDFCDQGMPAFQFIKEGPICKLSIVEGGGGGRADMRWQNVEFLIEDLRAEYGKFLKELYEELIAKYGSGGQEFWDDLGLDGKTDGEDEEDTRQKDIPNELLRIAHVVFSARSIHFINTTG